MSDEQKAPKAPELTLEQKCQQLEEYSEKLKAELYTVFGKIQMLKELTAKKEQKDAV
jgi:hypothetical protein